MSARALDRNGLEILTFSECLELLASKPVGRVAFVRDGQPELLPVNHLVLEARVAFWTASGGKLDAAIMGRPVAFEVDHYDPSDRTGWSVVLKGQAGTVESKAMHDWLEAQKLHAWADGRARPTWVVIRADEVSGRRIVRSRRSIAGTGGADGDVAPEPDAPTREEDEQ